MFQMRTALPVLVVGWLSSSVPATAQPLGTFRWQLLPYCNVLTLNVSQHGGIYTLDGTDDRCGADQAASARGLAFLNPNGTIGFGVTMVQPGGVPIHLETAITLPSLNGTWRDSSGASGAFMLTSGPSSGGPPRLASASGLSPGSVTALQIAPGAVGTVQLAANAITGSHVVDGSLSSSDIGDRPRAVSLSGEQQLALTTTDTIVRSVTITVPAVGQVIVNASGTFRFSDFSNPDVGRCSITLGAALDSTHMIVAEESSAFAMHFVPFGATRQFAVSAGPVTINLVCDEFAGNVSVDDTSLTAIFVPQ
jgi:hypothetical protein